MLNTLNETFFVDAALFLLAISALVYIIQFLSKAKWLKWLAPSLIGLTVLSLISTLVLRSIAAQYFALSNMYESLLVMTIGFLTAFIVIERWFKVHQLGWAVCLLGLVLLFYAGSTPTEINPLQAALQSYWRSIHVPPLLFSYGLFTLSCISSIAFLVTGFYSKGSHNGEITANREGGSALSIGNINVMALYDEVTYRCIAAGFPLLVIGVILGAVWANEAWGNYWSWDPKESMSLVTLLGYGVYLHMRINAEHSQKTLAYVSIIGYLLVLMTYVGVNMWGFGSLHSYGSVN